MSLSADQTFAVETLMATAKTRSYNGAAFVLRGSAGTGKTFTVGKFLDACDEAGIPVMLTATTNKAAKVLGQATGRAAATVHSRLGLKPKMDTMTGETVLVKSGDPDLTRRSVLLVDEISMADVQLLGHIGAAVRQHDLMLVVVGDHAQLPPVGDDPKIFDRDDMQHLKLETIHRQKAGSPVIELATALRMTIDGKAGEPKFETSLNENGDGVKVVSGREFVREIREAFVDGWDGQTKICVYTNAAAQFYNSLVRKIMFGEEEATANPIMPGETLIVNAPVIINGEVMLANEDEVVVSTVERGVHLGVKGSTITVPNPNPMFSSSDIELFVPDEWADAKAVLADLRKAAMLATSKNKAEPTAANDRERRKAWGDFFSAQEEFCDLRVPYASTTHKAQGSTYKRVFMDCVDMQTCREQPTRMRLLYTGVTRTSGVVICRGS